MISQIWSERVLGAVTKLGLTTYRPLLFFWLFIFAVDFYQRFVGDLTASEPILISTAMSEGKVVPKLTAIGYGSYMDKLRNVDASQGSGVEGELGDANLGVISAVENDLIGSSGRDDLWSTPLAVFRLLAIFGGSDTFAVLERQDVGTGDKHLVEFRAGDAVEGYTVLTISKRQLVVVDAEKQSEVLQLFELTKPLADGPEPKQIK